ncbi:MAG TPA: DNA and RNA helicase, partial [Bacillales bacterium]|nr:DNA and RNA helicase [Bacillales bacterium]
MFSDQYPTFQRGRVLKSTMLENLRDYPRNFTELYFQDYSDGIMTGAMISVDESFLTISKGIVKYNGRLYMLEKDVQLPYVATGKETLVKIKFHNEQPQPDFIAYETTVFLEESRSIQRDELELGRFKMKEGAMLRTKHTDFYDFATEYNTVNYIHCEFAGMETSTLHPLL